VKRDAIVGVVVGGVEDLEPADVMHSSHGAAAVSSSGGGGQQGGQRLALDRNRRSHSAHARAQLSGDAK